MSAVNERLAAEAMALQRSPFDPLRAIAAADAAGLALATDERAVLADLLELLEDDARRATLLGAIEPRTRLVALVLADAWVRGAQRLLWVGSRPRAIDRLAERCALPLHEVRPARGAYAGVGLFLVPDPAEAPPGLGRAAPFDRVIASLAGSEEPLWKGPTLWHGTLDAAEPDAAGSPSLRLAPGDRPPALTTVTPRVDEAERVARQALNEPLLSLVPTPLAALARRAAAGSSAALAATLTRLETRLGRMARAARAGRSDDGLETARQLAGDRGEPLDPATEAAMRKTPPEPLEATPLEAERARLRSLREALEAAGDPALEALAEAARRELRQGRGVCITVAARAAATALEARLDGALATGEDVDERLEAARRGPAVALMSAAERREARLDRVALADLATLRLEDGAPGEATLVVGGTTGPPSSEPAPAPPPPTIATAEPLDEALRSWDAWRAALALTHPAGHPATRRAVAAALDQPAGAHALFRLVSAEGARLLVVGDGPARDLAIWSHVDEARFQEGLALLPVATARLERRLGAARRERKRALAALGERREAAEALIAERRKRRERALGPEPRAAATEALAEAEAAIAPLDAERDAIDTAHETARRAALARFARPPTLEPRTDGAAPGRTSSQPRDTVVS